MLIIEGPDASGKSTLARWLAPLGLTIQESEGPPQSEQEIVSRIQRYDRLPRTTLFVRHPCVSNPIYDIGRSNPVKIPQHVIEEFYATDHFFIYCHPYSTVHLNENHVVKDTDTPEHELLVASHYYQHCQAYIDWALRHAHVIYRIGDDRRPLGRMVASLI